MNKIPLSKFQEAQKALKGHVLYSPMLPFQNLYLKSENFQPSGSFKIRGVTYCLSRLPNHIKQVVAFSTGNHAQAVALAAKRLNLKATIVMSPEALDFKVEASRKAGAEVVIVPVQERQKHAEMLSKAPDAIYIPPYDHLDVITGQGTIGMEILEQTDPAAIFVPVGGGGLIAGIAAAIKQQKSGIKIIGVEPKLEDDAARSFKTGVLTTMPQPSQTIADAVRIPSLGALTFPLIQAYVDDMITVTESQIADATFQLIEQGHFFVEPSGALSVAGAENYRISSSKPIVCILSGGNTTLEQLTNIKKGRH